MKMFLLGVVATVAAGLAVGAGVIYSGAADVAADSPHHPMVREALATARLRAVARNARDIDLPADLNDRERMRRGAGNYAAMCADCHLTPGETDSEIRKGLYPAPPDLTDAPEGAAPDRAAQRFWVIKHGIKSTAMAAWGRGGMSDGDIWDLVAFIDALPAMGAGEYRAWVAASEGHTHGGRAADHQDQPAAPAAPPAAAQKPPRPHSHDNGHHDHPH